MHLSLHHEHIGTVVRVPDGDGIEVWCHNTAVRIRLRHIDAPEDGQPYAGASQKYLQSLCLDRLVNFRIHKWDNYARAIADVTLRSNRDLSSAMLARGLAWWYRRYSRSAHHAAIETLAKNARKGLWKDPNPTPPWEYRKAQKLRNQKQC